MTSLIDPNSPKCNRKLSIDDSPRGSQMTARLDTKLLVGKPGKSGSHSPIKSLRNLQHLAVSISRLEPEQVA